MAIPSLDNIESVGRSTVQSPCPRSLILLHLCELAMVLTLGQQGQNPERFPALRIAFRPAATAAAG